MRIVATLFRCLPLLLPLAACVPAVMTPTVAVMPTPGKPLAIFAAEQAECRQMAEQQISPARDQLNGQVMSAALLTNSPDPLASGMAVAQAGTPMLQQQYDMAYSQCMYAKGDQVPGYAVAAPLVPDVSRRRPAHRNAARQTPDTETTTREKFIEPPATASAPASDKIMEPPPAKQ
ncbi:MAG TPA: hypothetical protein VGG57_12680 [Stellaceae bacterium]|jgi:hypothetical protein